MAASGSAPELMPGTTAPSLAKPEKADGGWRGPNLPRLSSIYFPASSAEARAPNSNFVGTRTPFRPVPRAGPAGLLCAPGGAAVQHESGSVPAASPVAGEMQRLRGEVRSAFPGDRGWRLGSGQGGKMAAPANGHRPAAGWRAGVLEMRTET